MIKGTFKRIDNVLFRIENKVLGQPKVQPKSNLSFEEYREEQSRIGIKTLRNYYESKSSTPKMMDNTSRPEINPSYMQGLGILTGGFVVMLTSLITLGVLTSSKEMGDINKYFKYGGDVQAEVLEGNSSETIEKKD